MQTTEMTINVPTETKEFAEKLGNFVKVAGAQLKDGFQVGQDIPAILVSAMNDLFPAINKFAGAKEGAKEMPIEAAYLIAKEVQKSIEAI